MNDFIKSNNLKLFFASLIIIISLLILNFPTSKKSINFCYLDSLILIKGNKVLSHNEIISNNLYTISPIDNFEMPCFESTYINKLLHLFHLDNVLYNKKLSEIMIHFNLYFLNSLYIKELKIEIPNLYISNNSFPENLSHKITKIKKLTKYKSLFNMELSSSSQNNQKIIRNVNEDLFSNFQITENSLILQYTSSDLIEMTYNCNFNPNLQCHKYSEKKSPVIIKDLSQQCFNKKLIPDKLKSCGLFYSSWWLSNCASFTKSENNTIYNLFGSYLLGNRLFIEQFRDLQNCLKNHMNTDEEIIKLFERNYQNYSFTKPYFLINQTYLDF